MATIPEVSHPRRMLVSLKRRVSHDLVILDLRLASDPDHYAAVQAGKAKAMPMTLALTPAQAVAFAQALLGLDPRRKN